MFHAWSEHCSMRGPSTVPCVGPVGMLGTSIPRSAHRTMSCECSVQYRASGDMFGIACAGGRGGRRADKRLEGGLPPRSGSPSSWIHYFYCSGRKLATPRAGKRNMAPLAGRLLVAVTAEREKQNAPRRWWLISCTVTREPTPSKRHFLCNTDCQFWIRPSNRGNATHTNGKKACTRNGHLGQADRQYYCRGWGMRRGRARARAAPAKLSSLAVRSASRLSETNSAKHPILDKSGGDRPEWHEHQDRYRQRNSLPLINIWCALQPRNVQKVSSDWAAARASAYWRPAVNEGRDTSHRAISDTQLHTALSEYILSFGF